MQANLKNFLKDMKLWVGVILFASSFILGKFGMILFFASSSRRWFGLFIYLFAWFMLFLGIFFVGKETMDFIKAHFHRKVDETVKTHVGYAKTAVRKTHEHIKRTHEYFKKIGKKQSTTFK